MSFNLALTYLNYRGLHVVGNAALAMTVFTLLPFVMMAGLGKSLNLVIYKGDFS